MTNKIKTILYGYGNVGKLVLECMLVEPDIETVGVISKSQTAAVGGITGVNFYKSIEEAPDFDVAILCCQTRLVKEVGSKLLAMGKRTVDIFDIHGEEMLDLYHTFDKICKEHNTSAMIASGWDPGIDSIVRTMLTVMIPHGITNTNFGPGMSMGHSVVVRSKEGVKDGISLTYPMGNGVHRRVVYVIPEEGADKNKIVESIKSDDYFIHDETIVNFVDNLDDVKDQGHGCLIERKGRASTHYNQKASFKCSINNPAVTAQIVTMCTRAVMRQQPGAYTMNMIPPCDYLTVSKDDMVLKLT